MNDRVIRNIVAIIAVGMASFAYLLWLSGFVSDNYALITNFIIVPLMFGTVSYFLLKGPLWIKLLLLAIIPAAHLVYFGGDPAKPGLENLLAFVELLFFETGMIIAFVATKYLASS